MERRVLIIDDSREMNLFLARFLQGEGFLVSTVSDPREALAVFDAFQPALVLLDLNMPYISGWEICRQIKSKRPVPVIIFSVRDSESDIARGFDAGADDYLIKPFELPDLLQRIERLWGQAEAGTEAS
ncbi:MAG: response regulator transcription factor [Chloroflexia bacterium]